MNKNYCLLQTGTTFFPWVDQPQRSYLRPVNLMSCKRLTKIKNNSEWVEQENWAIRNLSSFLGSTAESARTVGPRNYTRTLRSIPNRSELVFHPKCLHYYEKSWSYQYHIVQQLPIWIYNWRRYGLNRLVRCLLGNTQQVKWKLKSSFTLI